MRELDRRVRCFKIAQRMSYIQGRLGRQLEAIFKEILEFAKDEVSLTALELTKENSRIEVMFAEAREAARLLTPPETPASVGNGRRKRKYERRTPQPQGPA